MQVAERSDECLVQAGTIYSLLAANKRTCRGRRLSILFEEKVPTDFAGCHESDI